MSALEQLQVAPLAHCPPLEHFEEAVERVKRECDRLLLVVADEFRKRQDAEAELEDTFGGSARAAASRAAWALRSISRQLTRAHCQLVHPTDERFVAAMQVLRWANDAEPSDAPWRDAA